MPQVSVALELHVTVEDGANPVELERAIATEGRRAAKELYRQVLRVLDEEAVRVSGGARQRLEPRWVATLAGRMRIWRYRVKAGDASFHPLDRVLGLGGAEASLGFDNSHWPHRDGSIWPHPTPVGEVVSRRPSVLLPIDRRPSAKNGALRATESLVRAEAG